MRQGVFSGPFGNPFRLEGGTGMNAAKTQFPRAIAIPRTIYGIVGQSMAEKRSRIWFAPDVPSSAVFVPVYAGTTKISKALTSGTRDIVSYDCLWWANNVLESSFISV